MLGRARILVKRSKWWKKRKKERKRPNGKKFFERKLERKFEPDQQKAKCYESLGGSNILDGICYATTILFHAIERYTRIYLYIQFFSHSLTPSLCAFASWLSFHSGYFYILLCKKYRYVMLVRNFDVEMENGLGWSTKWIERVNTVVTSKSE